MRRLSVLALGGCAIALLGGVACGDDDDTAEPLTPTAAAARPSPPPAGGTAGASATVPAASATGPAATVDPSSPLLSMPVSRFTIQHDEVGKGFLVNTAGTFDFDLAAYARTRTFLSVDEGQSLLRQWGYSGGFQTGYNPEGRERAVLEGSLYLTVESHLFATREGAHMAYVYFASLLQQSKSVQIPSGAKFGEEQSAWQLIDGKVQTSSVDAVYHRYMFRRSNALIVVFTYGAEPFIKINRAEAAARTIDEKLLGVRPATMPTPVNTPRPTATPTPILPPARPTPR